ncbi:hypothetical protein HR09_01420 [Porphyromonas gulae]|uniref:hypothetical protein n=1 Tax=Porphyromonas gulae TaxID=111105 RepID=UPI00052D706E|nr:hypothetical protein [Porphyromonas gulae]KGN70998.1 hypothetical protein HR09_01420 [Porphyromonas gulae]
MTFKEAGNDWEIVRDRLENLTDYTLLDLSSGNDDCNFIIVPKAHKERIIYLADRLSLEVN